MTIIAWNRRESNPHKYHSVWFSTTCLLTLPRHRSWWYPQLCTTYCFNSFSLHLVTILFQACSSFRAVKKHFNSVCHLGSFYWGIMVHSPPHPSTRVVHSTPCLQTFYCVRCGPWRTWTADLVIMSHLLWPAELKALVKRTLSIFANREGVKTLNLYEKNVVDKSGFEPIRLCNLVLSLSIVCSGDMYYSILMSRIQYIYWVQSIASASSATYPGFEIAYNHRGLSNLFN